MPQVSFVSRLPRSKSSGSLRPPASIAPSSAASVATSPSPTKLTHQRKPSAPSLSKAPGSALKPTSKTLHHVSGSGATSSSSSSLPAISGIPTPGMRLRSNRPPTATSSSSTTTSAPMEAPPPPLRPVRSFSTLRQQNAAKDRKPTAPLTAAQTGPAPVPKGFLAAVRTRARAGTVTEAPETPVSERERERTSGKAGKLVPNKTGDKPSSKRKQSITRGSPVLSGTKRVSVPTQAREDSQDSQPPPQPSPPPKTRALIRRPLSLADRVFGGSSLMSAKDANRPPPSPSACLPQSQRPVETESPTHGSARAHRAVRTRSSSNVVSPTSLVNKSPPPTASKFSPAGPEFKPAAAPCPRSPTSPTKPDQVDEPPSRLKLPLSSKPRTPASSLAERRFRTPARSTHTHTHTHTHTPSHSRLPDTPALSTFLKDQSTRIGHIGEEDISLASSTSFHALTPPHNETTDIEDVSALAVPLSMPVRERRASTTRPAPKSPLSPTSPLSPRRLTRPIVAGAELRTELARLKNERVVLETRVAALVAEEGRLTGLAEAALRDRARALESAEQAELAREAAMWDAVVQAAEDAIEEERALKVAIQVARAIVLAM